MTLPATLRKHWLVATFALAALAEAAPAPTLRFDGADWQLRQGMVGNYDFERIPQAGVEGRADHLVVVCIDRVTPDFGTPELAGAMQQETRQNGTVLKAWTQPAATPGLKDYLILGRTDNRVTHEISVGLQRITTTVEGFPEVLTYVHTFEASTKDDAVTRWLARDGARIQVALSGWHEVPTPAELLAMARAKLANAHEAR